MKTEIIKEPTMEKLIEILKNNKIYAFYVDLKDCRHKAIVQKDCLPVVNNLKYATATQLLKLCTPENYDKFLIFTVTKN